jgi:hypothetical protein
MRIVTASMHAIWMFRAKGEVGVFGHGKRIHVAPEKDPTAGTCAAKNGDDAARILMQ